MSQAKKNRSAEEIPIDWLQVEAVLKSAAKKNKVNTAIVNTPFTDKFLMTQLGIGIIVLLLTNEVTQTIDRIALSQTEQAQETLNKSAKKFSEIRIPINHSVNIISLAIQQKKCQQTDDWQYLFIPELSPEQARFNQAGGGIASSVVYPLIRKGKARGALIFSYYKQLPEIGSMQHTFMKRYSSLVAELL